MTSITGDCNAMKVEFYRHDLNEDDIKNVAGVLKSVFLTTGPVTAEFERRFSQYIGIPHTVAVNSCTAALHLSLLALGIGHGDEVITTPMTFLASATPIIHTGAKPVFVDVEEDTGLLDVDKVERAITTKTRAILPVHLYGSMVDMRRLRTIADDHGLVIVEDCAHCIEGERDGIRPGEISEAACFSFYATKNLTCGEGGAIVTNDPDLALKLKVLRLHGMTKDAADRYTQKYEHWDMDVLGWKYNLDDIHAALMVDQIHRLDTNWKKRKAICDRYDEGFRHLPGIRIPLRPGKSGMHLYTIWVDSLKRDIFLHRIQEKGIGVVVNYRAIHTLRYFRETLGFEPEEFPVARQIGEQTISLPFYPRLTEGELQYVIETVREVVSGGS